MTVTFSTTRNEVIKYAYQELGVIGEGDTPSTDQITEASWFLNSLVKLWASDGMPLWELQTGYILPTTGVSSVLIGVNSANSVSSYVATTVSVAASLNATTVTLVDASDVNSGDEIGIDLGNGTMQWVQVSGSPVGNVVTLSSGLEAAISAGAQIYTYSDGQRLTRPLKVISAYQINTAAATRFKITVITMDEYFSLGGPTQAGVPTQVCYTPKLLNGVFYVYPQFSGGTSVIQITYQKEFDDMSASDSTFDFPQEYYLSIMKALASTMGGKYGLDKDRRVQLMAEAKELKDMALGFGTEEGSFKIIPTNDAIR